MEQKGVVGFTHKRAVELRSKLELELAEEYGAEKINLPGIHVVKGKGNQDCYEIKLIIVASDRNE